MLIVFPPYIRPNIGRIWNPILGDIYGVVFWVAMSPTPLLPTFFSFSSFFCIIVIPPFLYFFFPFLSLSLSLSLFPFYFFFVLLTFCGFHPQWKRNRRQEGLSTTRDQFLTLLFIYNSMADTLSIINESPFPPLLAQCSSFAPPHLSGISMNQPELWRNSLCPVLSIWLITDSQKHT